MLIVEDDQAIVEGLTVRLEWAGYNALVALSGEEGIARAVEHQPDAIILDVRMPGMSGLTVLEHLRDRDETRGISVMMISASIEDRQASLDAGARVFLNKPYEAKTVLEAVRVVVDDNG